MKKYLFILAIFFSINSFIISTANAQEEMVTIQIPASSIETIDVKYEKTQPSTAEKAVDATKNATKKTVDATKTATDKTIKATKKATRKTLDATKKATDKTVTATKDATDKTVKATKNLKNKTVDSTKEIIDNLNPNKPVTLEGLEKEAESKTLKNEKKGLIAAYNSRIKDINAKIKAAEKSTSLADVERQYYIHSLNKQKQELEFERDSIIEKYNKKIEEKKKTK